MTIEKLEGMLAEGEGYTIEFKKSTDSLSNDLFETVSSFSNRYGGYILLGVKEVKKGNKKIGEVIGVNPEKIAEMKKNFVDLLNNPQKMAPSLYLQLEEIEYKGRMVLWVYVPVSSQIEICCGKIYDRNEDADQDVTTSADLVANISNRKKGAYLERKIYPYCTEKHLKMELIPRVKMWAVDRDRNHPWKDMSDMELMQSAGLYEEDIMTGEKGFNLAAILLFGKPEVIQSCVPGYKVDAIYRYENMDRYDDRMVCEQNLIESYGLLLDFIQRHTNDKFYLEGTAAKSIRDVIAREIVSNILAHREFGSAFPAKIIIEKDKIYTENWSRTQKMGRITLANFTPYPKNPIIAKFFANIGYADSLGSGVRNLYKYTKIYSNAEPDIEEGDIFKITIPIDNSKVGGIANEFDVKLGKVTEVTEKVTDKVTDVTEQKIIELIKDNPEYKTSELAEIIGINRKTVSLKIKKLKEKGIIERIGSDRKGYWKLLL